jgi:hypothetical protein
MPTGFNNVPDFGQQLTDNILGGNLSGIISTRPSAKYMSGARTVLRINGKPVGFAFGVSWRIDTAFTEVNAIDNPLPEELVPKAIKVSGSISALHIPGQGAGAQLWQPDILSFLFHQYLTIEVRDSVTNQLLFYASKAVITSRQEDIKVDDLAQVSLSFMAIGFKDEKTPEIPSDATTSAKENSSGDLNTNPKSVINGSSGLTSSLT